MKFIFNAFWNHGNNASHKASFVPSANSLRELLIKPSEPVFVQFQDRKGRFKCPKVVKTEKNRVLRPNPHFRIRAIRVIRG